MRNRFRISLWCLGFVVALSASAFGQQSKSPVVTTQDVLRERRKTPAITTEDVLRISRNRGRTVIPTPVPGAEAEQDVVQRSFADDERLWAEELRLAQARVRELRSRADATELEINRLKNQLYSGEPRAPQTHKRLIDDVVDLSDELRRLRAEAGAAQADVDALIEEGLTRGFSASPRPRTISSRDDYRTRYSELSADLADSVRRAGVLQLRINDINRRILLNSGSGDEFYNNRLREQLQNVEDELTEVRGRISELRRNQDDLRQRARAAGISLN